MRVARIPVMRYATSLTVLISVAGLLGADLSAGAETDAALLCSIPGPRSLKRGGANLSLSQDGRFLLVDLHDSAQVWDVRSCHLVRKFSATRGAWLSPCSDDLLVAQEDRVSAYSLGRREAPRAVWAVWAVWAVDGRVDLSRTRLSTREGWVGILSLRQDPPEMTVNAQLRLFSYPSGRELGALGIDWNKSLIDIRISKRDKTARIRYRGSEVEYRRMEIIDDRAAAEETSPLDCSAPSGRWLTVVGDPQHVNLFDLLQDRRRTIAVPPGERLVQVSSTGVIATRRDEKALKHITSTELSLRDLESNRLLSTINFPVWHAHPFVFFSPQGDLLLAVSDRIGLKIWDGQGQELLSRRKGRFFALWRPFSNDGQTIVVAVRDRTRFRWSAQVFSVPALVESGSR